MTPRSTRVTMAAVLALAGLLYLFRLGDAPINVTTDEARFALQAHALAETGSDTRGNHLPLFFLIADPLIANHTSVAWWQPQLFYLMAGSFSLLPVSEFSARLPIALVALLNVWLIYAVARRAFPNPWYGVAAAFLLALTPAHFILGRLATDYFLPLAFALGWLLCLLECQRRDSPGIAVTTGLVLGFGLFSYITSWMVMPLYLALTCLLLWQAGKSLRFMALVAAGFALPLLPLAVWLTANPSMPRDVFANYKVSTGLRLVERTSLYWDYFNPSYLFFSGGSNMTWATRQAGLFPLALAVLLPVGLWTIFGQHRASLRALAKSQAPSLKPLWIAGFLLAPLPIIAALPEAPQYATARHLLAVPFGVLIGVAGLEWLMTSAGRTGQVVATVLVLSIPVQFVSFARDYFSDYRLRSAFARICGARRGIFPLSGRLRPALPVAACWW